MRKFAAVARYALSDALHQNQTLYLGVIYAVLICLFIFLVKINTVNGSIATVGIAGSDPMTPGELAYSFPELPRQIIAFLFIVTVVLSVIATADILPAKLTPGMLSILLARPVSRTVLLTGNVTGVICGGGILQLLFLVFCWVVYSVKCAIFDLSLLWICFPLIISYACAIILITSFDVILRKTALLTALVLAYCVYGTDLLARLVHSDNQSMPITILLRIFYYLLPPITDLKNLSVNFLSHTHVDVLPMFLGLLSAGFFISAALLIFRRTDF
jgi:ABC-type transport system involved in multi-copper enzyme maturation permease subunit